MQSLIVLLAVGGASVVAAPGDAPTVPFEQLDSQAQQQFLRDWLLVRFDRAAPIALDETEREKQSRRYAEVLKRVAAGKSLSTRGVKKLLAEIAAIEQAAIEQLSLRYRVQVYGRFRGDRAEYDRRMAAWRKMISTWEASPSRQADGKLVLAWLTTSLDRMRYDEMARLPNVSNFASKSSVSDSRAASRDRLPSLHPSDSDIERNPIAAPRMTAPRSAARVPETMNPTSRLRQTPRLAHRAEKPTIPQIAPPPRVVVQQVRPVIAPPEPPLTFSEAAEPRVMVDLGELTSRIHAYRLSLGELVAELQVEAISRPEELGISLRQLTELADRRAQLRLYRDLISQDEQKQVGELLPLDAPIALLGAKLFASRERAQALGEEAELAELDALSQQLAALASGRGK